MENVIKFPIIGDEKIKLENTVELMTMVNRLNEFIRDLRLPKADNDKLADSITGIIDQMKGDAFLKGVELGIKLMKDIQDGQF